MDDAQKCSCGATRVERHVHRFGTVYECMKCDRAAVLSRP